MSVRVLVLLLALSVALVGSASAQDASVRVTAEAEPMTATVGDPVEFTVRVEGVPATVVQTPDRPSTVNLEPQRRRPTTQHTRTMDDGRLRRDVTFSWRFRPEEAGTARIQPVSVVVRGETYTTGTIRVQVTSPSEDASTPTLSYPDGASGAPLDERDLFVQAAATTERAYQNEQVVAEYRLFYRPGIRLRHSRLADSWDAPGFWREELSVASRPTPQTQRLNGQAYKTVVLKRVALFPTRPGTLRVDPLRIETEAQGTMRMGEGEAALRGRFQPVRLASQRLSLRVRPLPPSAPASFNGAVGQFSMTTRMDTDSATVGGSVPLTVRIEGTGNLTTLSPPGLDSSSAIEVYEPTVESDIERSGRQLRGSKTFTYPLVPRASGRHALPPVVFSYFDPEAGRYETLRARERTLHVSGEASPQSRQLSGRTGDGLPVGDVAALMSADEARWARTDRRPLYRRPWAYLVLLLPILGAGGAIVYRRRRQGGEPTSRSSSDPSRDPAQTQLRAARRHLANGDDAAFYDAVAQALRTSLGGRLGLSETPRVRADLDRPLARHDVPEALRTRLYELLDRCDEGQYAPGPSRSDGTDDLLGEAKAVLHRFDEHLPPPTSPPNTS